MSCLRRVTRCAYCRTFIASKTIDHDHCNNLIAWGLCSACRNSIWYVLSVRKPIYCVLTSRCASTVWYHQDACPSLPSRCDSIMCIFILQTHQISHHDANPCQEISLSKEQPHIEQVLAISKGNSVWPGFPASRGASDKRQLPAPSTPEPPVGGPFWLIGCWPAGSCSIAGLVRKSRCLLQLYRLSETPAVEDLDVSLPEEFVILSVLSS